MFRFHRLIRGHRQIQQHCKICPLTWRRVHNDLAAHQLHELVRDGHAQTRSAIFFRYFRAFLFKWMKHPADKFRFHANSRIMNTNQKIQPSVVALHLTKCHADLALFRKFHGIGDKINHDLGNPQLVAD